MQQELDRMMSIIKDYKTGYGGVTDSFMRKELEMFAKDYHSEQCNIADVSGSVTYQGVTYNWGDKVVSPNGYEFFVVTDDGRWGLADHGGTFCELQHCDLTGYLHCH